jgi:predicted transcriptional regulator
VFDATASAGMILAHSGKPSYRLSRGNKSVPKQSMDPRRAVDDWQIQDIKAAIAEGDAGDLATDAEVKAVLDKWNDDARSVPPE